MPLWRPITLAHCKENFWAPFPQNQMPLYILEAAHAIFKRAGEKYQLALAIIKNSFVSGC